MMTDNPLLPKNPELETSKERIKIFAERSAELHCEKTAIKEAINAQQSKIAATQELHSLLADVRTRRENLLAGQALGEVDAAQIKEVEQELTTVSKTHDEAIKANAAATATIEGLQRKLAEKQAEIDAHNAQGPSLAADFFQAQAEAIGRRYMVSAQMVKELYPQMIAIGRLIARASGHSPHDNRITRPCWDQIALPAFNVKACSHIEFHHVIVNDLNEAGATGAIEVGVNDYYRRGLAELATAGITL